MVSFKLKITGKSKESPEDWANKILQEHENQEWRSLYGMPNILKANDVIQVKSTLDMYIVDRIDSRVWIRLMSNGWENLGRAYDFLPEKEGYKLLTTVSALP